ncbi:MAG TPA: AlpA family transcriptional regulator [Spongiibacteraceae bacterium]|nr:AlpA family transcriptional regulator [Spongiibacteraceae bacterium]
MAAQIQNTLIILRRKEVEARTGLSRSTIYKRIAEGTFPASVPLGDRAVGWVESEVENFLAGCITQRDSAARTK